MATSNKFTETTLVLIHEHTRRRHRVVYLCRFVGAFSKIIAYHHENTDTSGGLAVYIILIFVNPEPSPDGCSVRTLMMYASSVHFPREVMTATKCLEITNKNDLTEQWLKNHLAP